MAKHGRTLSAARPILAGAVFITREGRPIRLRTCEYVVPVRSVAAAVIDLAFLRQSSLFGEIVIIAVKIDDIFCNCRTFGIDPRTFADPVTRIFSTGTLCRQIRMSSLCPCTRRASELLAMPVCSAETANIGSLA